MVKYKTALMGALSSLLDSANISEATLGRETNIPRATINRITSGKTPDPRASTLEAIANYFDISVDQLLGKQPLPNEHQQQDKLACHKSIPIVAWQTIKDWEQSTKQAPKEQWISVDSNADGAQFALSLQGESMWPQFQDGTLLIVDPEKVAKNKDFVIVYIEKDDAVLFRQLIIDDQYTLVRPINDIFPTIQLSDNDKIIGVVTQARNNLN